MSDLPEPRLRRHFSSPVLGRPRECASGQLGGKSEANIRNRMDGSFTGVPNYSLQWENACSRVQMLKVSRGEFEYSWTFACTFQAGSGLFPIIRRLLLGIPSRVMQYVLLGVFAAAFAH